jgi:hypothetical protein
LATYRKCALFASSKILTASIIRSGNPIDAALQSIRAKAERVLGQTRRIVFAGFSLNPDDQSVWDLLTRSCCLGKTEKVTVVSDRNTEEIVDRYRKIYGKSAEFRDSGWKQFLEDETTA